MLKKKLERSSSAEETNTEKSLKELLIRRASGTFVSEADMDNQLKKLISETRLRNDLPD